MAATYTTPNELTGTADWSGGWLHGRTGKPLGTWSSMQADGDTVTVTKSTWNGPSKYVAVKAGETWAFSAEVRGNDCGGIFPIVTLNSATENGHAKADCTKVSGAVANPPTGKWQVVSCIWKMTSDGYIRPRAECSANTGTMQVRHYMVTKGTALPAYAPANGETLVASAVSATPTNILAPKADSATGTRWQVDGTGGALTSNAIVHTGVSVETPTAGGANVCVRYADSTGHANAVRAATRAFSAGEVARLCGDATLPAGMTPAGIVCTSALTDIVWSAPSLSIGGAVPLASSAHTPYATQDHVMVTYATQASLKVTDDSIKAEVTERGKLAGRVDTHTSKLEQLATSIKSLVKGESTYTDPDGKSATSGIYSLVTQTQDSVTALFGQYTKTADLAATDAVKDAKKAGTDAQAAASAAQSTADRAQTTADSASSTAGAAKSTADSLATMIREDATGITVGKSADGQTWSTGRTHMTADSFDVLDKAGNVLSSFGKKVIELGKNSQDAVINMLGGLVTIKATRTAISDGTWCEIYTDKFMSTSGYRASRIAAGYKNEAGFIPQGVAEVTVDGGEGDGGVMMFAGGRNSEDDFEDNSFAMSPAAYTLSHPEYLLAALMDVSKVPESLDTCGPGIFTYDTSTTSRPTDYGTCVCIRAGDTSWLFQVALPTAGDPRWRRNINGTGWTSWRTITSQ